MSFWSKRHPIECMVHLEGYGLVGGPPQQLPRGGLVLFITATFAAAVVTGVAGVRIWVDRLSDRAESPATIRCDRISAQEPAEDCKARTSRCVSSRLCKKLDGRLAMGSQVWATHLVPCFDSTNVPGELPSSTSSARIALPVKLREKGLRALSMSTRQ